MTSPSFASAEQAQSTLNAILTRLHDALSRDDEVTIETLLLETRRESRTLHGHLFRLVEESALQSTQVSEKSLVLESLLKEKEIILTELAASLETPLTDSIQYQDDDDTTTTTTTTGMDDESMDVKTMMATKLKRVQQELQARSTLKAELDALRAKKVRMETEQRDMLLKCQTGGKVFRGLAANAIQPVTNFLKAYTPKNTTGATTSLDLLDETLRSRLHILSPKLRNVWWRFKLGDPEAVKDFEVLDEGKKLIISFFATKSMEEEEKPSSTYRSLCFRHDTTADIVVMETNSHFTDPAPVWLQDFAGMHLVSQPRVSVRVILNQLQLASQ